MIFAGNLFIPKCSIFPGFQSSAFILTQPYSVWKTGQVCEKTHLVGPKQPQELGVYDMSVNVWE